MYGNLNPADLLTKPLALEPFRRHRDALLKGRVVLPDTKVVSTYVARLSQYLLHALSLSEEAV